MTEIRGVHHAQITIPTGTEDEARAFYCDLLGIKEVEKPPALRGRGGPWFAFENGFQVHLGTEDGVDRTQTRAHLAYEVTNLSGWRQKLEEVGVDVMDNAPIPGYDRFMIRDPFGNRVEFIERVDQAGGPVA